MQHQSDYQQTVIMGGMSIYGLAKAVYEAAPSWELVAPICFGLAALWNAWTNHRRLRATKG